MLSQLINTSESTVVGLKRIRMDGATQMRAALNEVTLEEYTEIFNRSHAWGPFPPVVLFYDGTDYWVGDGFHRIEALRRSTATHDPDGGQVHADVRSGTRRDAILYAAGANADHGLRRTTADKQRSIKTLLLDEEWGKWSDNEIARRCNVSPTTVGTLRKQLSLSNLDSEKPASETADGPAERTYTTKHGTTATMKTGAIGKGKPEPSYAPIWKIESKVAGVVGRNWPDHTATLNDIATMRAAANTPGSAFMHDCEVDLDKANIEFRRRDLVQAIHNVASQMEQARRREQPPVSPEQRQYESAARSMLAAATAIDSDVKGILGEPSGEAITVEPVPIRIVVDAVLFEVAEDACSARDLGINKIRKPFWYDGAMWTCVGVAYGGINSPENNEADCLRLHVVDEPIAPGERHTGYVDSAYRAGTPVTFGNKAYVLGAQWMLVRTVAAPVTVDSDSETALATATPTIAVPQSLGAALGHTTPGTLPADLAGRGWELKQVGGVGKYYCNNPSGRRATGVFDKPEDAIAAAYGMQRDLAWEANQAPAATVTEPQPDGGDDETIAKMWNLRTAQGVLQNMADYWSAATKIDILCIRDPNSRTGMKVSLGLLLHGTNWKTFEAPTLEEAVQKADRSL